MKVQDSKSNDLSRHRKRNQKAIKRIATSSQQNLTPMIAGIVVAAVFVLLLILISLNGTAFNADWLPTWSNLFSAADLNEEPAADAEVSVHFIDVGQGDCELIMTPDKNILIDGGEKEYGTAVVAYLKAQGIEQLDYVIVSHPHSDHEGGLATVISEIPTQNVIMAKLTDDMVPTTSTYVNLLSAIKQTKAKLAYKKPEDEIDLGNSCNITFYAPVDDYEDLNNYSLVLKFTHKDNSFLFVGDIESKAEKDILKKNYDLSADVLKVAHHGSSTSSTKNFLDAVGAKYGVIEVGSPNTYNHPNDDVLALLKRVGMEIYRTDENGNVVFSSDGKTLKIVTEKE